MASNKELFDLIKSLDSKEKRYLKLLMKALSGPKEKRYQNHFDLIVSMKKYDDLLWKRKMGLKISSKQIKETNNYLYDFILKGLMMYANPSDKSKNRILVDSQKVNTLMRKGLYQTAAKKIDELIQLSEEQQFFDLSLHLLNEKRSIHFGTGLLKSDPNLMLGILDNFEENLKHAQNINDYLRFLDEAKRVIEKWTTIRSPEVEKQYNYLLKNPLMANENKATCMRSKNLYFILKLALLVNLQSEKECLKECNAAINYFSNEAKALNNALYIGFMLNKKMEVCSIFKRYEELGKTIDLFESKAKNLASYAEKVYWFIMSLRHRLTLFYHHQNTSAFKKQLEILDTELYETCKSSYPTVYGECEFTKAKIHHLAGEMDEAIDCLNNIFDAAKQISIELLVAARILFLMIHYELGNQFYLPYAIQSLYRTILKTNSIYLAERELLSFLKQAIQVKNHGELKVLEQNLLDKWLELKNDKFQKDFFYFFPYCEWIESRLTGKTFSETLALSFTENN